MRWIMFCGNRMDTLKGEFQRMGMAISGSRDAILDVNKQEMHWYRKERG
jgi:hypothetical protein